jgi:hypothetical protein
MRVPEEWLDEVPVAEQIWRTLGAFERGWVRCR